MKGTIVQALDAVNERKNAIFPDAPCVVGEDELVLLLSGYDLDPAEVTHTLRSVAVQFHRLRKFTAATDEGAIGALLFADGLAIGLRIAEMRSRAGR